MTNSKQFSRPASLLGVIFCLFAISANAEVVELEGTIKAVDAEKREITIGKKTLDVAKKCQITIDGDEATLADLKADQKVTVEFDDALEVASSITVGNGASTDDAVAKDMNALQGDWEAIEAEFNGEALDRVAVRKLNRFVKIKGHSFHEEILINGKLAGMDGKFEINPKTKAFDFVGKRIGTTDAHEYVGIYEIKGDTLRLCCRANVDGTAKRPKQFKSDAQKPNWSHYYVYRRITQ